jgi:hypothetical protein
MCNSKALQNFKCHNETRFQLVIPFTRSLCWFSCLLQPFTQYICQIVGIYNGNEKIEVENTQSLLLNIWTLNPLFLKCRGLCLQVQASNQYETKLKHANICVTWWQSFHMVTKVAQNSFNLIITTSQFEFHNHLLCGWIFL